MASNSRGRSDADSRVPGHRHQVQIPRTPVDIPMRVIHKQPSSLQRQIERQRQLTRSATGKPKPRDKEKVSRGEQTPLVHQGSARNGSTAPAHTDVQRQLQSDGYRLDEISDDEELDLMIVPRPLEERSTCEPCACIIS